jgi:DNA-binding NarL/FixJ family response regulator
VIRVVVCDDHAVVRAGLERLIATFDGVRIVAVADGGEAALAAVDETGADVVLMDLEMPPPDGIESTRMLRTSHPEVAVVILTSFSDRARILDALDAGAIGYLLKDATPAELERGIRAAARGEAPLDPRAASELLAAREAPTPAEGLSPREREVLALVAEGRSNRQVGEALFISAKTASVHVSNILAKLGVASRVEAAAVAHRLGLLEQRSGP